MFLFFSVDELIETVTESTINNNHVSDTVNVNSQFGDFIDNIENMPIHSDVSPRSPSTPHPLSPLCSINHLDIDCTNDFCPYFIGNPIREPLSQLSFCSGFSTPQANTPMSLTLSDASTSKRKTNIRKDKGNVRKRYENEWIDRKRKILKNLGKEYISRKGVRQPKKSMKSPCKCRMKCSEKISNYQRKKIFKAFWKLGDHQKQWAYVSNLVSQNHKRRVFVDTQSRRKYTFKYSLPLPNNEQEQANRLNVCKKQFLATLAISEQFVYTAIQKTDPATGTVTTDDRGKHSNHPRIITEAVKKSVCDHIRCLQPVEAHYVRKDTSRLYLDSDLNFHKLFVMYNEWFDPNKYQSKALTERHYKTVVNDNFKLSFFIPKKDQCDICHIYTNIESHTEEERKNYEAHILNKNMARELKTKDKKEASSSNGKIIAATFDFQKVLNSPHGEVSVFYYKRKLGSMNLTVFDLAKKRASCYMWHEGEGKRGANEVSSCLADFVSKGVEAGAVEFRFWSDNCTGQNRNRIVFAAYMILVQRYNITIKHTFLEKGHTQQEGDSVHALIERCAKNKLIYTPMEWFTLVRWAKQDGTPYNVIEMDHTNFSDYKSTLPGKNWTKNLNGEIVKWSKIKELKIIPSDPNKLLYKYNLADSEYMTITTKTNTRRRQQDNDIAGPLYQQMLPIPKAKKDDLISLCHNGIIPTIHHNFYNNLVAVTTQSISETDSE